MNRFLMIVIYSILLVLLCGCNSDMQQNTVSNSIESQKTFAPEEKVFSTTTEDSRTIVRIVTTKDNYKYSIKGIDIIKDGKEIYTINSIVGYYDDISIDKQTSLAILNYSGRKWRNFVLLDIASGQVIYYEPFSFTDIKSAYRDNGLMMDYEINENAVIAFSCEKMLDADSILIDYRVHDNGGYIQSGKFNYNISNHSFDSMQQNPPLPEG